MTAERNGQRGTQLYCSSQEKNWRLGRVVVLVHDHDRSLIVDRPAGHWLELDGCGISKHGTMWRCSGCNIASRERRASGPFGRTCTSIGTACWLAATASASAGHSLGPKSWMELGRVNHSTLFFSHNKLTISIILCMMAYRPNEWDGTSCSTPLGNGIVDPQPLIGPFLPSALASCTRRALAFRYPNGTALKMTLLFLLLLEPRIDKHNPVVITHHRRSGNTSNQTTE